MLATAFMLTACSAVPAEDASAQSTAPVTMLSNHTPYFAMGEKGGYMTENSIDLGYDFYGELLFFIDEENKTMQPLCNRGDCKHNTEECTAFLTGSQGGYSIHTTTGKFIALWAAIPILQKSTPLKKIRWRKN